MIGAEVLKKSGKELITSVVVGYEVYQRIAMAGRTNIAGYNLFGCLAVLMKLMDLTEEQMNQLFGVGTACAIIPSNVHEITMSDSLNYLYGYRTENAVTMVKTVLEGFQNMEDALDDPTAFLSHLGTQRPEWITKDLNKEYMLMDILVKHWPANVFVQTYAELATRLVTKYKYDPDDVEEIILTPSVAFRHWYTSTGFESVTQAQFSIPYGIACGMYHPEPGAVWYQPETMKDPRIVALLNKVKATTMIARTEKRSIIQDLIEGYHPEKFMTVRLKDGREFTESAFTHPGHPSYMLTRDEFKNRFRIETKYVLSPAKIEDAINCICHLEDYGDASVLPSFLYEAGNEN